MSFGSTKNNTKSMVEEAISSNISACSVERRSQQSAAGFSRTHPSALTTRDTTWCIPDFVPIGGVAWPAPLLELWKSMNYSSQVGLFPALCRVWLAVDNKLILWDYREGREFCIYDEIPELILAVGTPVKPRVGVFQPHVTYVLPVATASIVFLIGLCVVDDVALSEIKVVSLGYSAATDTLITKLTGLPQHGRVFCSGSDGNVYELQYQRENTAFVPKIRLLCFSYLFSQYPVLGQITGLVNAAKRTWTGPKAGIRDICVDERRELLISLDEKSVLSLWRIGTAGLTFVQSLSHKPNYHVAGGSERSLAPLLNLFVIDPDHDGCTLVAIAQNGDQFRYRYLSPLSGDSNFNLVLRGYVASYVPAGKVTCASFAGGSTVILSCCGQGDVGPEEIVAATSPKSIVEPFNKYRDLVSSMPAAATGIARVEAIERVLTGPRRCPNDLCSQTFTPPSLFLIAHRHGLSAYLQMRPVDTLYTIVSIPDPKTREGLLQRFSTVYNVTDYTTMLLQIAVGGLHAVDVSKWQLPSGLTAHMNPTEVGMVTVDQVGRKLLEGNLQEARRIAHEILRTAALPTTQTSTTADARQMTIAMSPLSCAVVMYLSRVLYDVWDMSLRKLQNEDYSHLERALLLLSKFLESLDVGAHNEDSLRVSTPHQWELNKVIVYLVPGSTISLADVNKLQMAVLVSCYDIAKKSQQTVALLRQLHAIPLHSESRHASFAQIVRDQATAERLGQYVSSVVLATQQGIAASERQVIFNRLLKQCPYFFTYSDVQEFQARADIETMSGGESFGSYSEAQMARWAATVAPKAASYWTSGALQSICEQLNSLKKEDISVRLLLHAANQLDPTSGAFALYLAERNVLSAQKSSNSNLYSTYQTKLQVLALVRSILESAWLTHRSVVNMLLGGPQTSGTIWTIEPSDEMAHCYLFDWLRAPRDDATLSQALRDTLVAANSPFLETYLASNAAILGEEYTHYLWRVQHNHKVAIEQGVLLAQSPLTHIPSADRLRYRIRCLSSALECARECNSDQIQQVEQRLHLLEAQQRLCGVIADYIASGLLQLDSWVNVDGRKTTERQLSLEHVEILCNYVATASSLLQIAGMYSVFGGAEVQLDVLVCSNVSDPSTFASCVYRAYELRGDDVESITRRLIERYCRPTVSCPISSIIRVLEGHHFRKHPEGTDLTVQLLTDCNVDVKVLFYTYQDILEDRDPIAHIPCSTYNDAGVSTGFLIHSICAVVFLMAQASQRGAVQANLVAQAMRVVQEYNIQSVAGRVIDSTEREAYRRASDLLQMADTARAGCSYY